MCKYNRRVVELQTETKNEPLAQDVHIGAEYRVYGNLAKASEYQEKYNQRKIAIY